MKHLATFAFFAVTALGGFAQQEEESTPKLTLDDVSWGTVVNNTEFDAAGLKGKVVVVEKWGVNCPPCIASLPDLAKLAKRYEDKGLAVVGLEVQNGTDEQINKLLKDARVKYPVTKGGNLRSTENTIPNASVFDASGKLVWQGNPLDNDFEKTVKAELRKLEKQAAR
jgi:thiol-disulfide isomerase/thioredoxin